MFNISKLNKLLNIKNIIYFEVIDSTNKKGIEYAKNGINEFLIIAGKQTKGRGRFQRKWFSQEGGLYISLGIAIEDIDFPLQLLNIAGAIAIKKNLENIGVKNIMYKWPNDIYVNNKKISGILSEIANDSVIIGIGVNVNQRKFNREISDTAISLFQLTNRYYKREYICGDIIKHIFDIIKNKDIIFDFLKNNTMINKSIIIDSKNYNGKGIVKGIDREGKLIVETSNGIIDIIEGDIKIL